MVINGLSEAAGEAVAREITNASTPGEATFIEADMGDPDQITELATSTVDRLRRNFGTTNH